MQRLRVFGSTLNCICTQHWYTLKFACYVMSRTCIRIMQINETAQKTNPISISNRKYTKHNEHKIRRVYLGDAESERKRENGKEITKNVTSNNEKQHERFGKMLNNNRTLSFSHAPTHKMKATCIEHRACVCVCAYLFRQLCFLQHKFLLFRFLLMARSHRSTIEWLFYSLSIVCLRMCVCVELLILLRFLSHFVVCHLRFCQ